MINFAELRDKSRTDRHILGLLPCNTSDKHHFSAKTLGWSLVIAAALFIGGCIASNPAHAYSNENIVNAIYKTEGGNNAQYPYGIRSVKCETEEDCRKVCLRTVKNNRIRYAKDARRNAQDYISYLAGVYCPIKAGNDPQGLNRNWLRNVRYFLGRET